MTVVTEVTVQKKWGPYKKNVKSFVLYSFCDFLHFLGVERFAGKIIFVCWKPLLFVSSYMRNLMKNLFTQKSLCLSIQELQGEGGRGRCCNARTLRLIDLISPASRFSENRFYCSRNLMNTFGCSKIPKRMICSRSTHITVSCTKATTKQVSLLHNQNRICLLIPEPQLKCIAFPEPLQRSRTTNLIFG